jgi:hypothetical protein
VGGSGEALLGVVGEFEAKKSKIRLSHTNWQVGQTESASYRLEDLPVKSEEWYSEGDVAPICKIFM